MKYDFKTIKLKDCCSFQEGYVNPSQSHPEYFGGSIKWIRAVDLNNANVYNTTRTLSEIGFQSAGKSALLFEPNTIVISKSGTIGRLGIIKDYMCGNRATINIKPKENIDLTYLFYFLRSKQKEFEDLAVGSVQKNLYVSILESIEISLPSLPLQRKIVSIVKDIDDKIELNNAINNNLEQQTQLLFKSWFVDFEPFNGTMPSDWEVVPFETIVDFQNGYAFKSKELLNEPSSDCYQVFKQGHIARGGGFIPDGTKSWYPKKLASKLEKFVLKKGDILMAMTDMKDNVAILGNTAIMPIENEYIVNQRVGHLRANGYQGITYPFIYLLTNSTDFLIDLRSRANSGVQVNLSSAEIKASQTVLPSEKVNTAFSEITLPMFEAIISNQLENQRLTQLRDTLLPKLMSGKLDVSDLDL